MVVGAGHGHDLADAEVADARLGNAAPLGGIADGADGDDGSLTGHEPRHRGDGADAAGIGERQRRALELVRGERVGARAFDQSLVLVAELLERQLRGVANHRDDERTRPVLADAVHRQTEVRRPGHACRLAVVGACEMSRHRRARAGGAGDRVSDEVGEGHLARVATGGERAVQLAPAAVEDVDTDGAERRCGRDVAAALHVVDERRGRAPDRLGVLAVDDAHGGVVSRCGAGLATSTSPLVTMPPGPDP